MMRGLAGLAAMLGALAVPLASRAEPVRAAHLEAELVAQAEGVAPGATVWLAVRQTIDKGWHTYWRNPGDAGEPTKLTWTLPAGWRVGDIDWPAPKRLPVGPLMDYGYEGEVLLPVPLTAPAAARPGETIPVKVQAQFLVCAETCVPTQADLFLALPVTAASPPPSKAAGAIAQALASVPRRGDLQAVFQAGKKGVALAVTGPAVRAADKAGAYFYPYLPSVIAHAAPQAVEQGADGLTLTLAPAADFAKGASPARLAGVLAVGGQAYEVVAQPGPPPPGASGLGPPPSSEARPGAALSLLPAALLAFAGGLILNLMPCVFPILAMKAAALAGHAREAAGARRQGLAFGAGVMATFLALAGALIALKAVGATVGWGFQLQSPAVVAALALLMLGVAMNLSGVFEAGTSLQGAGQGLASRRGLIGAFFTGALSVVVAAPCTAPFMGPAVGWAFTQGPAAALFVFAGLALGFAAPFVLVAFAPGLIARLPKPGPWMAVLKTLLAFPMYAAAAWLAWVLTVQAAAGALALLLGCAVVLALAAWLLGLAQRRARGRTLGALAAVLGLAALAGAVLAPYQAPAAGSAQVGALNGEPYSRQRLAELRGQGRVVLVDYTAAWCVSCQVNDRLALSTPRVAAAFKASGAVLLKADWTRRDPVIAADLARFGRAGVPLYLVYPADGGAPAILPSILTEGIVLRSLDVAAHGKG